jgi:flagellin
MALGVLNNLSAIYAENNLNNTNNSLQKVLEQLSSGSRINSGADDAAGLSLVNGLGANSAALTQSETNATEGAGLLQVADGALSQVTTLLDRAITLATEASNGTLNTTQESAANQEYQTILSEINNIGQTTTYNQEQVFNGTVVAVYTGDSSAAGSSIDDLNIRTLSESSVGDSGGKMAYSSGANSVFINLSTSTANAAGTDTLNAGGQTTLDVNYLVKGANGTESTATTSLTVGTGTSYANTANGLISAINSAGLGLSASLSTQAQAGVAGGGTQTGIEISGGLVSAGVDPSSVSTGGTLDLNGLAPGATLALGATVTITQGSISHIFNINSSDNTLTSLAGVINNYTNNVDPTLPINPNFGVTANVITNGDGTQSLALTDTSGGGALSVNTTTGTTQVPAFPVTGTTGSIVPMQTTGATINGNQYIQSLPSTIVVGTGGTDSAAEQLTEGTSITIENSIANDTQIQTFVVGNGADVDLATGTHYTGNVDGGIGGNTLGNLADAINAQSGTLGVYATVGANGLTINTGNWVSGNYASASPVLPVIGTPTTLGGQDVSVTANNLTAAASNSAMGLYTPTLGGVAGGAAPTVTVLDTGNATPLGESDILSGSFTLADPQNGNNPVTFTMNGTTTTWLTLLNEINGTPGLGVSATWNGNAGGAGIGGLVLTATSNGVNTVAVGGVGITDGGNTIVNDPVGAGAAPGAAGGGSPTITDLDTHGQAAVIGNILGGSITLNDPQNSGPAVTFTMNGTTDTWTTLMNDITASTLGVTAAFVTNLGGAPGEGGLQLTSNTNGVNTVTVSANTLTNVTTTQSIASDALGAGIQPGVASQLMATPSTAILQLGTGNITDTGVGASALGGAISISYDGATQVFIMGAAPTLNPVLNAIYTGDTTVTSLIDAINSAAIGGVPNLLNAVGVNATDNPGGGGTGGIYLQGVAGVASPFTLNTIVPTLGIETPLSVTSGIYVGGNPADPTGIGSVAVTGQTGNNAVYNITVANPVTNPVSTDDTMAGSIIITNGGVTDTFIVGTGPDSYNSFTKTGTYYTNNTNATVGTGLPGLEDYGSTLAGLAADISAESSTLALNAQANTSGLTLTQNGTATTGPIVPTSYTGGNITVNLNPGGNGLTDVTKGEFSTSTSTNEFANENDTLSGALVFSVGSDPTQTVTMADVTGAPGHYADTVAGLISYINSAAEQSALGSSAISAAWVPSSIPNSTFGYIQLTSGTEGASGTVTVSPTLTSLTDTTSGAALTYRSNSAYNTGLSSGSKLVYDSTTGQPDTAAAPFVVNNGGQSGIATISYSDGAGEALNTTDLTSQIDAQTALNDLNLAITDVAAQDGYIGAQINTLNSISQVMSTQQENVISAQNAIQATDYASATSNMSKYEILSQTGIAALAQANSIEQEVTKLLQ